MKKFILSVFLAALAVVFTGCGSKLLTADVTIENSSSNDMYYIADYNLSDMNTVRTIAAGKTESLSLQGLNTESSNSSEEFRFWYCSNAEMEAWKEQYSSLSNGEWFLLTEKGKIISEKNKGQKYTVKITDDGTGYSVTVEY